MTPGNKDIQQYFDNDSYRQFIFLRTYSRWDDMLGRRESWVEVVDRFMGYMKSVVGSGLTEDEYNEVREAILWQRVMPSMRLLWCSGDAVKKNNASAFNCTYTAIDSLDRFPEILFLLCSGCGVGFSVEKQFVNQLPEVALQTGKKLATHIVGDSREGWADALRAGLNAWWSGKDLDFNFSKVRPVGSRLKTFGGRACLAGDTIVYKDRKKTRGHNEITIKELYEMERSQGFWKHKSNHFKDVKIRSFDEESGEFYRNNLITVINNGKAPVYEIITENGYRIKATDNHRFMADNGEYEYLSDFKLGDLIAVNGSSERKTGICIDCKISITRRAIRCKDCAHKARQKEDCSPTTVRQRKECQGQKKEYCEICGHDGSVSELQVHHKDQNPYNNNPENLQTLCEKHHRIEDTKINTFGDPCSHRYLSYDKIISIRFVGTETVYDLQMEAPNHNFVANGFVTHNSGPEPLRDLLKFARNIVLEGQGRKLRPLEVHDIVTKIAMIVVAGGTRRSSEISISDLHDEEMMNAKHGKFYETQPQRAMANNSAVYTKRPTQQEFMTEWLQLMKSGSGERGIFNRGGAIQQMSKRRKKLMSDGGMAKIGVNPCSEIILRSQEMCNLTSVVCRADDTKEILMEKVKIATILGTYQSMLTDFHYLSPGWKKNCEEERLLGVSLNGQYDCKEVRKHTTLRSLKRVAIRTNKKYAKKFKINPSTAITCTKPEGCQIGSTLVNLNNGIYSLEELGNIHGRQWQDVQYITSSGEPVSKFYVNGAVPTKIFNTEDGNRLECSHKHKYKVYENGKVLWKSAPDIREGDNLIVSIGDYKTEWSSNLTATQKPNINCGDITQPENMTEKLAWLLGLIYGDGSVHEKGIRIYFNRKQSDLLVKIREVVKELFNIDVIINDDRCLYINSTWLLKYLEVNGLLKGYSENIKIPAKIRSSGRQIILSFINGLWRADGGIHSEHNDWSICTVSHDMALQLLAVLRAIGFNAKISCAGPGGFGALDRWIISIRKCSNKSQKKLKERKISENMWLDKIVAISDGHAPVYDITVDTTHEYVGNGVLSHNTGSQMLNCAPGAHPRYAKHYIRRVRISATDPLFRLLADSGVPYHPEVGQKEPNVITYVLDFPTKSPANAITRHDVTAIDQLKHWKKVKKNYAEHTVSSTIYVGEGEWVEVAAWLWRNWDVVGGLSFLPREDDDHVYQLAPYEQITEKEYNELMAKFPEVDYELLSDYEKTDNTQGAKELACSSGSCEIDLSPELLNSLRIA